MVLLAHTSGINFGAGYEVIESFAGHAVIHRTLRKLGLKSRAIDIVYWEEAAKERKSRGKKVGKTNPCDLLEPAGFLLLGPFTCQCMHTWSSFPLFIHALRCPKVDARRHPVFKGRCISHSLWHRLLHMGCNKPRELPSELLGAAGRHGASHSGQCQRNGWEDVLPVACDSSLRRRVHCGAAQVPVAVQAPCLPSCV